MSAAPTIEGALRAAAVQLRAAGIERGRAEAEILLAHLLAVRRLDLLAHSERLLTPEEAAAFAALLARRAARYPLPYLTRSREFMGLSFFVDERVLIPRPETETLVETAMAVLREATAPPVAVDVGTGSGAIAVSLAHYVPAAHLFATDISADACAVARENARRLGVADRVQVREGDLLAPVEALFQEPPPGRAAVLCANLPYIPEECLTDLQAEVRDWEPRLALTGGSGGLHLVERLLRQAPACLRPGGMLLCEIGPEADQPARLTRLLAAAGCWRDARVLNDLAGLPRVVIAILD